ncbi:serine O-acetyltransferase EpsC [Agriterribacter sp.]|uniref:serine O-acetyltransferase EpsC n=1 Tax=Agriterribacter sp. TaxID=2821509 RepID=UPI002C7950B5|nr:serine O-acetyltransferase EpsC [Agriterribacter sp.]HRO45594.1 serine O-acetyltransferase [Agriterribacter sp.]HRQ18681.1 serine O-acetyltransferase [Agriterribacter sp.]
MSQKAFIAQIAEWKNKSFSAIPDKELATLFIDDLFSLLFLPATLRQQNQYELEKAFESLKSHLSTLVYEVVKDGKAAQKASDDFFDALPGLYHTLQKDAQAIFLYDPAAQSPEEIVLAYPGFYAIAIYRFSNQLWKQQVKMLPRLFTEYAHSKTGIDIHPGATIGESFFIDHGTGIVIGETTVIGKHVKIYQGVTIGALSTSREKVTGKRHPTIEDNVIIYSGATILGGETLIGKNSIIGGNVWLTQSVPPNVMVENHSGIIQKDKMKEV